MPIKSKRNNGTTRVKKVKVRMSKSAGPRLARPGRVVQRGPVFSGNGNRMTLKHKEAVLELFGTGGARQQASALINPGDSLFMRWGSRVARNYETYRFRKLRVIWEPALPSTSDGYLRMYFDFDARDSAAVSSVEAMSAYGSVSGNIWSPLQLNANAGNLNKLKSRYVRERANQVLSQLGYDRTSDAGLLHLYYSTSLSTGTSLGIFFVEYEVELETPQVEGTTNPEYNRYGVTQSEGTGPNDVNSIISGQTLPTTVETKQGMQTIEGPANFTTGGIAENLLSFKQPGLYKLVSQLPVTLSANGSTLRESLGKLANIMPFVRDIHNSTNSTLVPADTAAPHGRFTMNTDVLASTGAIDAKAQVTKYFNITQPVSLAVRVLREYVDNSDSTYVTHNATEPTNVNVTRVGDYSFLDILKHKAYYPEIATDNAVVSKPTATFGSAYI